MSIIQFSDSTNKTGLVELLGRATGTQDATTSSYPLKQKTVDINDALDKYLSIARKASPTIKIDDTNFTGEPLYTQNLSSGTQAYTYTNDASSAQIIEIDRVDILRSNGTSKRLTLFNPENVGLDDNTGLASYKSTNGEPEEYRIVGKNIYLYPAPNYNSTNGLKLYHSRAPSYFVSTDTTKTPGINNLFHAYLWIRPAYFWVMIKKGAAAASGLKTELTDMEDAIKRYFENYSKDATRMQENQRMRAGKQSNK